MQDRDTYNVLVNGVSLNNSWRSTLSEMVESIDMQGRAKVIAVDFIIEAPDAETLALRWNQTKREFSTEFSHAVGYVEDPANPIFDYRVGDGVTMDIQTGVSDNPELVETRNTKVCTLEIWVAMDPETVQGGSITDTPLPARPEELIGNVEKATTIEAGGALIKSVQGGVAPLVGPATEGPFTITGITDDNGEVLVTIAEVFDPAEPPDYPYVQIAGTANYNGNHRVKNMPTTSSFRLATGFVTGETSGTLFVGEVERADDLYEEIKPYLIALLELTEKEAILTDSKQHMGDGTIEFVLATREMDQALGFDPQEDDIGEYKVQAFTPVISKLPWEGGDWSTSSDLAALSLPSERPEMIGYHGEITINRKALDNQTLKTLWETSMRQDALDYFDARSDGYDEIVVEKVVYDYDASAIIFDFVFLASYTGLMEISYNKAWEITHDAWIYPKGDGTHGIQVDSTEPIALFARSLTVLHHEGSKPTMTLPPLTETGYAFHLKDENEETRGPGKEQEMEGMEITTRSEVWLRYKPEATPEP
jgi:hypothetical protein